MTYPDPPFADGPPDWLGDPEVCWTETGHCVRMVDEWTGGAYWQTQNDSSRDAEPPMAVDEPLQMLPASFPVGCKIVVLEPRGPGGDPELTPNIADGFVGEAGAWTMEEPDYKAMYEAQCSGTQSRMEEIVHLRRDVESLHNSNAVMATALKEAADIADDGDVVPPDAIQRWRIILDGAMT